MTHIFDKFKKKKPRYPTIYLDNIIDKFSRKLHGSEKDKFEKGKFFSNYYECYMYAVMLGLKHNYKLPFDRVKGGDDFSYEIDAWQHKDLVDYLLMGLLARSDWQLIDIERLDERQSDDRAFELLVLMEQYAHGGFDIIKSKIDDVPHYFESEFSMVIFLNEPVKI